MAPSPSSLRAPPPLRPFSGGTESVHLYASCEWNSAAPEGVPTSLVKGEVGATPVLTAPRARSEHSVLLAAARLHGGRRREHFPGRLIRSFRIEASTRARPLTRLPADDVVHSRSAGNTARADSPGRGPVHLHHAS